MPSSGEGVAVALGIPSARSDAFAVAFVMHHRRLRDFLGFLLHEQADLVELRDESLL